MTHGIWPRKAGHMSHVKWRLPSNSEPCFFPSITTWCNGTWHYWHFWYDFFGQLSILKKINSFSSSVIERVKWHQFISAHERIYFVLINQFYSTFLLFPWVSHSNGNQCKCKWHNQSRYLIMDWRFPRSASWPVFFMIIARRTEYSYCHLWVMSMCRKADNLPWHPGNGSLKNEQKLKVKDVDM